MPMLTHLNYEIFFPLMSKFKSSFLKFKLVTCPASLSQYEEHFLPSLSAAACYRLYL